MNKKLVTNMFLLIFLFPFLNPTASAATYGDWTENFSTNLDNWSFYSYNHKASQINVTGTYTSRIATGFTIKNGELNSGFNYNNRTEAMGNDSYAWHDSTINYGNWSFDAFLDNWTTTDQHFEVYFLFYQPNNNYDFLG